MKRKLLIGMVNLILLVCLMSCAGLQEKWDSLTPDQQARVILNGVQDELTIAFDSAKVYFASTPERQKVWKEKAVPLFDVANKSVKSVIELGKTGPLTPSQVYSITSPPKDALIAFLVSQGWKK